VIGTFGIVRVRILTNFANIKYFEHDIGAPVIVQDGVDGLYLILRRLWILGSHLLFIARAIDSEIIDPEAEILNL